MKRYAIILAIASMVLAASCQSDRKQIKESAQGYLDAMANYKPTEARPYATEETCNSYIEFAEWIVTNSDPKVYANNIPAEVTLGKMRIEDSCAAVAFHKSTPTTQQDDSIYLVKKDGKWLVEVIVEVPDILRGKAQPRTFTKEQIAEMRKNGKKNVEKMEVE